MARSLTDQLLDAHATSGVGEPLAVRVDHAIAAGDDALLVLAAFAATGVEAARTELALVCADTRDALEVLGGTRLQHAAARIGARFAPPGLGRAGRVHVEHYAAPGRLALGCGASLAGAGGLGTLALAADALELAAVWAGAACVLERPRVVRIALEGEFPAAVDAADLMMVLAGSPRAAALRGCVVEFGGPGLAAVPVEERIAAAALAPELGALAVVWPSDDATHEWLAAHGRESEWKRLEAEADAPFDRAVALDGLVPLTLSRTLPPVARPVGEEGVLPVATVVLGAATPPGAFDQLARALSDGTVAAAALTGLPGSRAIAAVFERRVEAATPVAASLASAAAEGMAATMADFGAPEAIGLCFGVEDADLPGAAGRWRLASPSTCIASALAGRLEDARGAAWREAGPSPSAVEELGEVLEPGTGGASEEGPHPLVLPPVPGESARGPVLLCVGDDVGAEDVLRWGPRLRPMLADLALLAEQTFADVDAGFAARARAAGGGFVVAGERCGAGPVRDRAVLVLATLGVRAVIARSFAPGFAARLAAGGVLPLVAADLAEEVAVGDELEIPALAEGLAAGRALGVRNLARGHGYTAWLDLEPRDAERARVGGRLRELDRRDAT